MGYVILAHEDTCEMVVGNLVMVQDKELIGVIANPDGTASLFEQPAMYIGTARRCNCEPKVVPLDKLWAST